MKGILALIFLLLLRGHIIGQNRHLELQSTRTSQEITIDVGDFVKIELITGQKIEGNIPVIESDYFLVGIDTIRPIEVYSIRNWQKQRRHDGKAFIVAGGIAIAGGICLCAIALNSTKFDTLNMFISGVILTGGGLGAIAIGGIINLAEGSKRRVIGRFWTLKIA